MMKRILFLAALLLCLQAQAAITVTQSNSASNASVNLNSVTSGADVIVIVGGESAPTSVTDDESNTYNQVVALSSTRDCAIYLATNVTTTPGNLTVQVNGMTSPHIIAVEVDSSSNDLETDQTNSANDTTEPYGVSITTAHADTIVVMGGRFTDGYSIDDRDPDADADGTQTAFSESNRLMGHYQIYTSTVTTDMEFGTVASEDVTLCIASFNEISAGGATIPIFQHHQLFRTQ